MKTWPVLLFLLLCLCAILGYELIVNDATGASGMPHPRHPSMNAGGDPARHDNTAALAFVYGALLISSFILVMKPGFRPNQTGWRLVAAVGVACVLALGGVFLLYERTKGQTSPSLFLGFPSATAMMLYLLWPLPVVIVVLYAWKFDAWVLSPDEHQRFRESLTTSTSEAERSDQS